MQLGTVWQSALQSVADCVKHTGSAVHLTWPCLRSCFTLALQGLCGGTHRGLDAEALSLHILDTACLDDDL